MKKKERKSAVSSMKVIWIFVSLYILLGFVDCELIGNNTFTITSNVAINDGLWRASASCNTVSQGITYGPHETYIVSRFGVPILTYKDYLAGGDTKIAADGKFVTSRVGYGGQGSLTYGLEFSYDLWLGAGSPSGDCYHFRGSQAAENFANTVPELTDTPADTLIDTKDLTILHTSSSGSQALCTHTFAGISVGAREALILIYFTVPVKYQSDYFGGTILHEAADDTWYLVKDGYSRSNSATYIFNFKFTTINQDASKATCLMYVSENDAVLSAASLGVTTTTTKSTTVGTTDLVYITNVYSTGGSTGTVTQNVTPEITQRIIARVIIAHAPRTNATSGFFVESRDMRNKYVGENSLWMKTGVNLLQCIRTCLADDKCVSVFFLKESSVCTGHNVIYGSGDIQSGVLYYVYS